MTGKAGILHLHLGGLASISGAAKLLVVSRVLCEFGRRKVLAMSSYPTFDPNGENVHGARNRPVTDAYEAGSVMKVFTIAAARLMRARATICADSRPAPEIGKLSTARCVCAP